jgi:hypothetical protein
MEVPFLSFHIPQISNLIKSETDGAKNKGRKAHGGNMYLTRPDTIYIHLSKVQNIRNLDIYKK